MITSQNDRIINELLHTLPNKELMRKIKEARKKERNKKKETGFMSPEKFFQTKLFNKTYL